MTTRDGYPLISGSVFRAATYARRFPIWVVAVVLLVAGSLLVKDFATPSNVDNLIRQGAALGIVTVAMTVVIVAGGIDLSVGSLMSLVVVVANGLMAGRVEVMWPAIGVCLLIGALTGVVNGGLIIATGISPLLQTFGMLSVLQGAVFVLTDRSVGSSPPEFQALAYGSIGPIPVPAILLMCIAIGVLGLMRSTPFGRYVYAVGSSPANARAAGIPIQTVTFAVYVMVGCLAAVAGLVLAARLGSGYTFAGASYAIDAIVAVVIGGTALGGGRGGITGSLGGVIVLVTIGNLLNLLEVSAYWQQIVKGMIVVMVVALYGFTERRLRA